MSLPLDRLFKHDLVPFVIVIPLAVIWLILAWREFGPICIHF